MASLGGALEQSEAEKAARAQESERWSSEAESVAGDLLDSEVTMRTLVTEIKVLEDHKDSLQQLLAGLKSTLRETEDSLSNAQSEKAALDATVAEHVAARAQLTTEMEGVVASAEGLRVDLTDQIGRLQAALHEAVQSATAERQALETSLGAKGADLERTETELEEANARLAAATRRSEELSCALSEVEHDSAEAHKKIVITEASLAEAKAAGSDLAAALELVKSEAANALSEAAEKQAAIDQALLHAREGLADAAQAASAAHDRHVAALAERDAAIAEKDAAIAAAQASAATLAGELGNAKSDIEVWRARLKDQTDQTSASTDMVSALKQANTELTERLEALGAAMEALKQTASESADMAAATAANLEARLAESAEETKTPAEGLANQQVGALSRVTAINCTNVGTLVQRPWCRSTRCDHSKAQSRGGGGVQLHATPHRTTPRSNL